MHATTLNDSQAWQNPAIATKKEADKNSQPQHIQRKALFRTTHGHAHGRGHGRGHAHGHGRDGKSRRSGCRLLVSRPYTHL